MKELGQKLKDQRERLGINIAEASMSTKINPRILQAIEDGDRAQLPAQSFLRGFIRTYAVFLKLNVDETLSEFHRSNGLNAPSSNAARTAAETTPTGPKPQKPPQIKDGSVFSKFLIVAGVVTMIALIIGIKSIVEKYEHERKIDKTADLPKFADETKIPEIDPNVLAGQTSQAQHATANPTATATETAKEETTIAADNPNTEVKTVEPATTPATVTETTKVAEAATPPEQEKTPETTKAPDRPAVVGGVVGLQPPIAQPSAPPPATVTSSALPPTREGSAASRTTQPYLVTLAAESPKAKEPVKKELTPKEELKKEAVKTETAEKVPDKPAEKTAGKKEAPQEIIVEALDKVRVTFQIDDGQTQTVNLQPDQIHTIKAKRLVVVDVSDGGAVNVIQNGLDRGVPGTLGKSSKLTFPKQ